MDGKIILPVTYIFSPLVAKMEDTSENETLLTLALVSGALITVFLYCIFPVFVQVYRSNREYHKTSPLCPIINELYRALWVFYISGIISLPYLFVIVTGRVTSDGIASSYVAGMILIVIFIVVMYLLVHQLFKLPLLAFQTFLKLIFSSSNSYFLRPKFTQIAANVVCIVSSISIFFHASFLTKQPLYQTDEEFRALYFRLYAILLVSTFLNVYILLKNELTPVKKPDSLQTWIFYQTVAMASFKLLHVWVLFFKGDGGAAMRNYMIISIGSDVLTCVMFVQVSYLIVYRHKIRNLTFKDLFSSAFSQQGRIEPRESIQSLSSIRF